MKTLKQTIKRPGTLIATKPGVLSPGQSMEEFLRKALAGGEPIEATAKVTYNDRKDGVLPQHDIRADRFDMALEATTKAHAAQALARHKADFPEPPKDENGNIIPAGEA